VARWRELPGPASNSTATAGARGATSPAARLSPLGSLDVARLGSPGHLRCYLHGRGPRRGQGPAGLVMQSTAHGRGKVEVHGLPDQLMPEGQAIPALIQDVRREGLIEGAEEVRGAARARWRDRPWRTTSS
jgi:hypothetical protein